jgi:hypothetical protein
MLNRNHLSYLLRVDKKIVKEKVSKKNKLQLTASIKLINLKKSKKINNFG